MNPNHPSISGAFRESPVSNFVRATIIALLSTVIPHGCAHTANEVDVDKIQAEVALEIEQLTKSELLAAVGASGEGFQPDGHSYALCVHMPNAVKIPFEATRRVVEIILEELGIPKSKLNPGNVQAKTASMNGWHCELVSYPKSGK